MSTATINLESIPRVNQSGERELAEPRRFTLDGSAVMEESMRNLCDRTLAGIRSLVPVRMLEGLLLGGGYGRGEGGVLRETSGDRAYNDLDFYVFVRGNDFLNARRFRDRLHALGQTLAPHPGLEIEFKVLSQAKLQKSPPSMFYYDLVSGHHHLWGGENLLDGCQHHRDPAKIPAAEASRLLMNRCAGLLLARERLDRDTVTDTDADFIHRNQAKAQLALGDAVLAFLGQYHWSCRERHRRLKLMADQPDLPGIDSLLHHHREGIAFKLHPRHFSRSLSDLRERQERITEYALEVWLWLESRRLGHPFASAMDYAASQRRKCPETPAWRNWLLTGLKCGPSRWCYPGSLRHPRERVLNWLALLLWEPEATRGAFLSEQGRRELGTDSKTPAGLVRSFTSLWARFS